MKRIRHTQRDGERGAILIHVALAVIALMAFSTFVIDYGVFWLGRRQAQNSADAGALAGAISLIRDSWSDRTEAGPAKESAHAAALANVVFGEAPSVDIVNDVTFPPCPDDGSEGPCIKVDVYRTADRGNALPIFAGMFVGLVSQDVQASATAKVLAADTVECLKPWAVVDKWDDTQPGGWDQNATFDPAAGDSYTPPSADSPNSGFYPFEEDGSPSPYYGMEFTLHYRRWQQVSNGPVISGWFSALALEPPPGVNCGGGCAYRETIGQCTVSQYSIGDLVPTEQGAMVGPTNQGTQDLINLDPGAHWDPTTKTVVGSTYTQSPRIVPLVIVNPQLLLAMNQSGKSEVPISNFLGFFVEHVAAGEVTGRLVSVPGMSGGNGGPAGPASWAQFVSLIR